ncbi:broad-complex core protein-like [Periplaneta americana]|uniref:broad-complex core protein-like n=1 Tax=Periplaneta americana TaxID=6978 RepID=UPI0037E9BC75
MGSTTQQYCLRWNNHRSNLLAVFDELLRNEAFTDVTLACEGGTSVKCHKMVLAACSSYFQSLFTELPCRHPVVVLKDVKYSEMKAILEYMYRGEVNVAQDQLAALLKVAEALKVKGLVEDSGTMSQLSPPKDSAEQLQAQQHQQQQQQQQQQHQQQQQQQQQQVERHREDDPTSVHSPPSISTSTANVSPLPHSSSNISPPHSSGMPGPPFEKNPYNLYGKSPVMERGGGRMSLPMWAMPGLPLPHHPSPVPAPGHPHAAAAAMLNSCYEAAGAADMSPLKRKKLQGLLMSRDTPILRTVLGQGQQGQQGSQGQADSSQPMSLVCQPDSHVERNHSNGSAHDIDKSLKTEPTIEDARSPYTDISMMDEESSEKNNKIMLSQSFPGDVRGMSPAIATYVPTQKPEWKRYKQYTRNDIMSAIDAVRNGMSALQAARKYGVPSRTLYDKVKKMGITTSRPFNKRGSNVSTGGSSYFPYSGSGGNSGAGSNSLGGVFAGGGGGGLSEGEEPVVNPSPSGPMMEPLFLQHALDGMKREMGDREAMAAMAAAAAAAHAASSARSGNSSSPGENGNGHSPSPSPSLIKYIRSHNSMSPNPAAASNELHPPVSANEGLEEEEDQVEDLSVTRKPEPVPTTRVIMPPMNPAATAAAKKEDVHDDDIREHCTSDDSHNTSMETAERD